MPTRKWLVAALYDSDTNQAQFERDMWSDIRHITNNSAITPFPYEVKIEFLWIPIHKLERKNRGYDDFVELSIVSHIRAKYTAVPDFMALALMLDRDLLTRNGLSDTFVPIVRHRYFSLTKEPLHFMCCFGGTPTDGVRCRQVSSQKCDQLYRGCFLCKFDDILAKCKHTCYWYFIGMLLGAWPRPRVVNPTGNKAVQDLLPSLPIFTY